MRFRVLALAAILAAVSAIPSFAATPLWTSTGLPVCTSSGDQRDIDIAPDGAGGAILVWKFDGDFYAGRVTADGSRPWGLDGVPLSESNGTKSDAEIISDGAGGVIVVWEEHGASTVDQDLYGQRLDANGNRLWSPAKGKVLDSGDGNLTNAVLVPDGSGGAIIAWLSNPQYYVYAQRIDGAGNTLWGDRVVVDPDHPFQGYPYIATDGAGGAIVMFTVEWRSATRAHRLDANGNPLWTSEGVDVGLGLLDAAITSDGAGGAIMMWGHHDIIGQRVDAAGNLMWGGSPIDICAAPDTQYQIHLIPDGSGGAIAAFEDYRDGNEDIYAQRGDDAGTLQWAADGAPVIVNGAGQTSPTMSGDGNGGVFLAWADDRDAPTIKAFAQHLDANGVMQWTAAGVEVSPVGSPDLVPRVTSDGDGGVIIGWESEQGQTQEDIYAQHYPGTITTAATSATAPQLLLRPNAPNPFARTTTLPLSAPHAGHGRIDVFDVQGRRVYTRPFNASAGWQTLTLDAHDLANGVYFCRVRLDAKVATRKIVIAR